MVPISYNEEVMQEVDVRCENLLAERAVAWWRQREEGQQPVEHLLEQAWYAGEDAQLALQAYDGLAEGKAVSGNRNALSHRDFQTWTRTTQTSLSVYRTSARAGNSAMRSLACRCSSFCFSMSGQRWSIWPMRPSVSAWCSKGWLNAFARDA